MMMLYWSLRKNLLNSVENASKKEIKRGVFKYRLKVNLLYLVENNFGIATCSFDGLTLTYLYGFHDIHI